jgi:hypothetical protein
MPLPDSLAEQLAVRVGPVPGYPGAFVKTLQADVGVDFLGLEDSERFVRIVWKGLCHENGTRCFSDEEEDKVRALPIHFLVAVAHAATGLNRMSEDIGEDPSEGGQDGGSPTG